MSCDTITVGPGVPPGQPSPCGSGSRTITAGSDFHRPRSTYYLLTSVPTRVLREYSRGCRAAAAQPTVVDNSCEPGPEARGCRGEPVLALAAHCGLQELSTGAALHRHARHATMGGRRLRDSWGDMECCVRRTRVDRCISGAIVLDRGHVANAHRRCAVRSSPAGSSRPLRPSVDRPARPPGGSGWGSARLYDGSAGFRDLRLRRPGHAHPPST